MNFKKIALAAAAAAAATPAMAADLPVVAEPVNYVEACSAYGNGYFKLPGQDTCIRLHGRIRTQWTSHDLTDELGVTQDAKAEVNHKEAVATFTAGATYTKYKKHTDNKYYAVNDDDEFVQADGTTATTAPDSDGVEVSAAELARARTVVDEAAVAEERNDYTTLARGYVYLESMTATEFASIKTYTELTASWNEGSSDTLGMGDVYVQLGFDNVDLLIGRTGSRFDTFGGYSEIGVIGVTSGGEDTMQVGISASLGNGFTAQFAVEDSEAYGGAKNRADFVAALSATQGMFSGALSAAAHAYSEDDYGYAVAAKVEASLMDNFKVGFGATYAQDALAYAAGSAEHSVIPAAARTGLAAIDALGNDAWVVAAGLEYGVTDQVTLALDGSYASYEFDFAEEMDLDVSIVNGSIAYAPVAGLVMSLDAGYEYAEAKVGSDKADADSAKVAARLQYSF